MIDEQLIEQGRTVSQFEFQVYDSTVFGQHKEG